MRCLASSSCSRLKSFLSCRLKFYFDTLRFLGCDEVKLEDFRRQNVLFSLAISHEATKSGSAYRVVFDPSCGLDGSLRCRGIEVLEAVRKKPRA